MRYVSGHITALPAQTDKSGHQDWNLLMPTHLFGIRLFRVICKMMSKSPVIILMFVLSLFAGNTQAEGNATKGQELAEYCADCHGDDGLGDEENPPIAGMDAANIRKQLADFKSGVRVDEYEMMVDTAADLSEQDIADLAAYFATLPGE